MLGIITRTAQLRTSYPLLQDFKAAYKYFENEKNTGPATRISRVGLMLLGPIGLGFAMGFAASGIL